MSISDKSSKCICKTIIKLRILTIASQEMWNDRLRIRHEDSQQFWRLVYLLPYKAARDTKAFQFRLSHRFIPCNKFLCNIRIRQDDLCPHCNNKDTSEHYFFSCDIGKEFWTKVCNWFGEMVNVQIREDLKEFLFAINTAFHRPVLPTSSSSFWSSSFTARISFTRGNLILSSS